MPEPGQSGQVCRACGKKADMDAQRCEQCGAELITPAAPQQTGFIDDDPRLRYVDPENRVELDRFERRDEAELACGLLRFNGIPCELSGMVIPGLSADTILWAHNKDADLAWALLADTEREATRKENGAA